MEKLLSYLRQEWPLTLILSTFLVLGIAYSAINPIHEGTDELRHYRFVQYIIQNRALPVQGEEACRSQSHHPPLYYMGAALLTFWVDTGQGVCDNPLSNPFWGYNYWEVGTDNKNMYLHQPDEAWPWRGEALAAHIARLLNVLIGAAAVVLTYRSGRLIWPERPAFAAGGTAFIAFNPQFLYMAGTLNNDVIAAMAGALILFTTLWLIRPGFRFEKGSFLRWGLILAAVYSIALMSKFNLAPLGLPLGLAVLYVAYRQGEHRPIWPIFGAMLGGTLLMAGWWFLRNQLLYGEPTGFRTLTELWGVREASSSWGLVWLELPGVWASFWGRFGFGQIPLPWWVYRTLWHITLLAVGGTALYFLWERLKPAEERERLGPILPGLLTLTLIASIALAVVIAYVLVSPAGAMGRFLFPGLPAIGFLLFWGLTRWFALLRLNQPQWTTRLAVLLNGGLLALAVWALTGILAPAYAAPPGWTELPPSATATAAVFHPFAQLHGYEISSDQLRPGESLTVTLYWEVIAQPPGDFYLFVHIIDQIGSVIAQRDTHPAAGKFPTGQWRTGDRFVDRIELPLSTTAPLSDPTLTIGFYAPIERYRLAITDAERQFEGDSYPLTTLAIRPLLPPEDGGLPNPQDRNFEEIVRLRGYELSDRQPQNGELTVTLYWELMTTDSAALTDKTIFVGATQKSDPLSRKIESETDLATLFNGATRGEIVKDEHKLVLNGSNHPDLWTISFHIFDFFTSSRVNMIGMRGNWIGDELFLPDVRPDVRPEIDTEPTAAVETEP